MGTDREIIFRGFDAHKRKWYYGDPKTWTDGKIRSIVDAGEVHLIDFTTVGQYTGLKDTNGKMIFEGDTISDGDNVYTVCFECGGYWATNDHAKIVLSHPIKYFGLTVIGNVYEVQL